MADNTIKDPSENLQSLKAQIIQEQALYNQVHAQRLLHTKIETLERKKALKGLSAEESKNLRRLKAEYNSYGDAVIKNKTRAAELDKKILEQQIAKEITKNKSTTERKKESKLALAKLDKELADSQDRIESLMVDRDKRRRKEAALYVSK